MSVRVILAFLFCFFSTSAIAQLQPLRAGDTLQISVWQDPKLDRKIVIGPDGMISFPLAGHIRAGGLTPQELEKVLRTRLQKNYSGDLDVTVALGDVNKDEEAETKPRIYVTGEVLKPGPYSYRPSLTVAQAIAQAGGLGIFAASRRIQVHRQVAGADSIFVFDFKAYEAGTLMTNNINLRSGDVIIVPERGLFE